MNTETTPVHNRCGCNHWITKPCPERNCSWNGKRPVDHPAPKEIPQPASGDAGPWKCFHCGEVLTTEPAALEHFGPRETAQPACQIDIAEYRRMQESHRRQCEDDTEWHRAFYAMGGDHERKMRRHGDDEYARGLRDGVNLPADSPERASLAASGAPQEAPGDAPPDAQLCKFYGVTTFPDLVKAMEHHIGKLQAKLPAAPSFAPQQVREG